LTWCKYAIPVAALALVGWGVRHTVLGARDDLAEKSITLRDLHLHLQYEWLVIAAVYYLLGMLIWSLFWHQVLLAMRQRPHVWDSVRAYFISQPGKYVPGKFMVVALRSAVIRSAHVNVTLAAAASFVETLTVMSIGAVLGALLLPVIMAADWWLEGFAICAAIGVGLPAVPSVFRWIVKWTRLHRLHPEIDYSLEGLSVRRLAPGWVALVIGWIAMGGSLAVTLRAIPALVDREFVATDLPLLTACAALSTVAGFASLLPGGIVAREGLVVALLAPHFGATPALIAAIVNRFVMIVADLVAGAFMFAARRRRESRGPRAV
jgi:uncharacterized membrane protein YbhN (UPF0104 family)